MAPALAQLLEGDITSTRPNPYRRVLLACMRRGAGLEHGGSLQSAAAVTFDAAITRLDGTTRAILEACGMVPRQRTQTSNKVLNDLLRSLDLEDDEEVEVGAAAAAESAALIDFPRNKPTGSLFEDDEGAGSQFILEGEAEEGGAAPGTPPPRQTRALSGVSDVCGDDDDAYPPNPNTPERSKGGAAAAVADDSSEPPSPAAVLEASSVAEVISSLCAGLITTPARGKDNSKVMAYGFVCAHALTLLVRGDTDAQATLVDVCKHYIRRSASYIANCCEDDSELYRVFHLGGGLNLDSVAIAQNSALGTSASAKTEWRGRQGCGRSLLRQERASDGGAQARVARACARPHTPRSLNSDPN
jgi:hypothetical protein